MKFRFIVWLIYALAIIGCDSQIADTSREQLNQANSENAALRSKIRKLESEKAARDRVLVERAETLSQILDRLEALTSDGLEIRKLTSELKEYGHEDIQIAREVESRISALERRLNDARDFEAELQAQLDSQTAVQDELSQLVRRYQTSLETKTQEILELKTQFVEVAAELDLLKSLNADLQSLADRQGIKIGKLEAQVVQLEERLTAFVLAASKSDISRMRRDGIIRRHLGRLEPDPQILSGKLLSEHFQTVDARNSRLHIPGNMSRLRIRSIHSKYEEIYTISKSTSGFTITLHHPEQFWQLSRFLIVEAR